MADDPAAKLSEPICKLTCGYSRKIGEANYSSRGASVLVEVQLDTTTPQEEAAIREKVKRLFAVGRRAVDEELAATGQAARPSALPAQTRPQQSWAPGGSQLTPPDNEFAQPAHDEGPQEAPSDDPAKLHPNPSQRPRRAKR